MSFDFMEIETQSFEKLESARTSSDVGQPIPRRDRKWKPDFDSDTESISNLSDIENLQIEPTSKCKKSFKKSVKTPFIEIIYLKSPRLRPIKVQHLDSFCTQTVNVSHCAEF